MTAAALPLPDPPLAGEGFVLRPWHPVDAPALAAAWADPEVRRWTEVPVARDEAAARRWIEGDPRRRQRGLSLDLVIDRAGAVAGEVGLAGFDGRARTAEIGWWVGPEHRGHGLAAGAVQAVAEWATEELSLETLLARCHPSNRAALGVARRAGFVDGTGGGSRAADEVVWCYPDLAGGTVRT